MDKPDIAALDIGLCWGTIHRASLIETIELAARHGFPTLSFPPWLYTDCLDQGHDAKALRRRMSDAGVRVTVVDAITAGLPGMPDEPVHFDGKVIPRSGEDDCYAMAEALGAPCVNISHFGAEPVSQAELTDAVGGICRRAGQRGLTIVLEFVPGSGIRDIATAAAIARDCGEANCKILLDSWHLARTDGTSGDIVALPPGSIGAMQLSDRIPPPPGEAYVPMTGRLLPGEGSLPLFDVLGAALANSPGVSAEIEVFSEELTGMSVDAAAARTAAAVAKWRAGVLTR